MTAKNDDDIVKEIFDSFGEEYIKSVAAYVYYMATTFLEKRFMAARVYVDKYLLMQCTADALVDIHRLKHFHNISKVNSIKLHAYLASWILRRKPLQRLQGCQKNPLFANELFVMDFLFSSLDFKLSDATAYNQLKAAEIPEQLFYHLKYRNTNPQTLELFLKGLNCATN